MNKKLVVKPTKANLVVGIIISALFAIFGIVFFAILAAEDSYIGMGFLVFWMLIVLITAGSYIYSLINYQKSENMVVGGIIDITDVEGVNKNEIAFDEKLRKLEQLKNENLISEKEFSSKRNEILNQKW